MPLSDYGKGTARPRLCGHGFDNRGVSISFYLFKNCPEGSRDRDFSHGKGRNNRPRAPRQGLLPGLKGVLGVNAPDSHGEHDRRENYDLHETLQGKEIENLLFG